MMEQEAATLIALRIPAFEAVIHKAVEPRLRSRPVAVVTSFRSMGRVLTVCPVAGAEGLAEEMTYPEARARCPEAAFFTPDKELGARALTKLMERAQAFSPLVESAGGGRVLLDARGTERLWGGAGRAAELVSADITTRLRLPVAAGVATRRPWSLLASRAAGEDGVYQVEPGTEDAFLGNVPVAWVDGVSAKTHARLVEMNVHSVGQLRQFARGEIHRQFGRADGDALWNALHPHPWEVGIAIAGPATSIVEDAVRVEAALSEATVEAEKVRLVARTLAGQAAATLRARDLGAAHLRLALLHADGMVKTAHSRTGGFIQDETVLLAIAEHLLGKIFRRRVRVSRLWLSAEKLAEPQRQGVLFPPEPVAQPPAVEPQKAKRLLGILDRIHSRYGEKMLCAGSVLATPCKRAM